MTGLGGLLWGMTAEHVGVPAIPAIPAIHQCLPTFTDVYRLIPAIPAKGAGMYFTIEVLVARFTIRDFDGGEPSVTSIPERTEISLLVVESFAAHR